LNLDRFLRILVPRRIISAVRLLDIFQRKHGHIRLDEGFPVNGRGEYQPWLTYPVIEFLEGFDFSGKTVFEYGSGSSTLFWASRAKRVTSVELDGEWYRLLLHKIPANVTLLHEPDGVKYAKSIRQFASGFDVIAIDGAERHRCAIAAIESLAPGGMIILDNAEWYPNTAALLASAGLIEVPFSGFSPINAFCSTSTVFLSRDFAFPLKLQSRCPPVGGRALPTPALDDKPISV
jgi:hypothetical protein